MDKKLFYASIKERYLLNHPSSSKKTYHVVLDIKGSGMSYNVGDCVAIYPTNQSFSVEKILNHLNLSGHEIVQDKNLQSHSFEEFLSLKANLVKVKSSLASFSTSPVPEDIKSYIEGFNVADFLVYHNIVLSPQQLVDHLLPLTPRFYSIASSMKAVGEEVHLTIALTQFESCGIMHFGTCSYFLTQIAPLHQPVIPLYFQQTRDFTLPFGIEDKDIIMIGPGTGIAPFMGFLQERIHSKHQGRNWLFFGERNMSYDYYYQKILESHVKNNKLRLDLAFSRDQTHKIYVQDKMLERAQELFFWLEKGAYLYVCGDATRMAKDVEKTLHKIISSEKKISEEETKNYIKILRRDKRYLRDVY